MAEKGESQTDATEREQYVEEAFGHAARLVCEVGADERSMLVWLWVMAATVSYRTQGETAESRKHGRSLVRIWLGWYYDTDAEHLDQWIDRVLDDVERRRA